jgi:predicted transcriptional regulator
VTKLERFPEQVDRVESQIVQLRTEMGDEFSAVRAELAAIHQKFAAIDGEFVTVRGEIHATADAIKQELREEIRAGDEETRRLMRVLHEEVIGRFALLEEGRPPRGSRKRRGDGA